MDLTYVNAILGDRDRICITFTNYKLFKNTYYVKYLHRFFNVFLYLKKLSSV
jgi:hypothetical protein